LFFDSQRKTRLMLVWFVLRILTRRVANKPHYLVKNRTPGNSKCPLVPCDSKNSHNGSQQQCHIESSSDICVLFMKLEINNYLPDMTPHAKFQGLCRHGWSGK